MQSRSSWQIHRLGLAGLALVLAACGGAPAVQPSLPGTELAPEASAAAAESKVNQVDVRPAERTAHAPARKTPAAARIGTDAPSDVSGPPATAEASPSGLRWKVLERGDGGKVGEAASVVVHYSGWTTDGKLFDSSVKRGEPLEISLRSVIRGWTEGVGDMQPGEIRRLWIPEALAYQGKEGAPKGMLVFDVELVALAEQ